MKVVKRKSGEIVYRQEPEFELGKGLKSAVVLEGGTEEDYEEVDITQAEWDSHIAKQIIEKKEFARQTELNAMTPLIESIEESLSLPKGTIMEKMKGKV